MPSSWNTARPHMPWAEWDSLKRLPRQSVSLLQMTLHSALEFACQWTVVDMPCVLVEHDGKYIIIREGGATSVLGL